MSQISKKVQLEELTNRLANEAAGHGLYPPPLNKTRPQSLHNFIMNSVDVCKSYLAHKNTSFTRYFTQYYASKYPSSSTSAQALYTHLRSWKQLAQMYYEPRLVAFCLEQQGSQQHYLRDYLKIRKQILIFTSQQQLLDEVALSHQETLAVVHRLFDQNQKRFISKRLSELFVNLNGKLINISKLQSSVFVEFLISCKEELSTLDQQVKLTQHNRRGNGQSRSSNSIFNSRIDTTHNGFFINKSRHNSNQPSGKLIYSKIEAYDPTPRKTPTKSAPQTQQSSRRRSPGKVVRSPQKQPPQQHQPTTEVVRRFFQMTDPETSVPSRGISGIHNNYLDIPKSSSYSGQFMQTAEKELQKFNRMDRILDEVSQHNSGSYVDKDLSSYVAEKYSENWSQMLKVNQNFKERMLRNSKEEYESSRLRVREGGSIDYSEDRGIHFREDAADKSALSIHQSKINRNRLRTDT